MVNGPECAPHTLEEALSLWKQYNKVYFCYGVTQNFFNDTFNENQFLYMYIDSSLFVFFLYYIILDTHLSFFQTFIIPIIPKNRCDIPHFL